MNPHDILIFVHILLFVFWLGADLGVFLLATKVKDGTLSYDQRALLLKMALTIDLTPRVAFVLMFAVGCHLALAWGSLIDGGWLVLVWALTLAWLALVLAIPASEGKPRQLTLMKVQTLWLALLTLLFVGLGIYALVTDQIFPPDWLAWKVILFGAIAAAAIGIDLGLAPFFPWFERLRVEGSTPEIEAGLRKGINGSIRFVLILYGLLVVIAFLGTTKPVL